MRHRNTPATVIARRGTTAASPRACEAPKQSSLLRKKLDCFAASNAGGDAAPTRPLAMMATVVFLLCLAVLASCFLGAAHAATIEKPLPDSTQEQAARAIFSELKCVVCEGQSLADSDAELAREMRAHVRERVASGESPAEILSFFRIRYGDSILMTPPVESTTYALWLAPLFILLLGALLVWRNTKHDPKDPA